MRSSVVGGSSSGGDHTPVSDKPGGMPSGNIAGDQWAVAATRPNGRALCGLERLRSGLWVNWVSCGKILIYLAAIPPSLSRIRIAAKSAATPVPGQNRHE